MINHNEENCKSCGGPCIEDFSMGLSTGIILNFCSKKCVEKYAENWLENLDQDVGSPEYIYDPLLEFIFSYEFLTELEKIVPGDQYFSEFNDIMIRFFIFIEEEVNEDDIQQFEKLFLKLRSKIK